MVRWSVVVVVVVVAVVLGPAVPGFSADRIVERLDRGLIARPIAGGKVYLSWRLLPTDAPDAGFLVERRTGDAPSVMLNRTPIRQTTDFVDENPPPGRESSYVLRAVLAAGVPGEASRPSRVTPAEKPLPYLEFKLEGEGTTQKAGIGDLDGDGCYDLVLKRPADNIDPYDQYWKHSPDTYTLEAYSAEGARRWSHDLGWAIERGIWYSPYVVHDLDGDGAAEVAVKTGEGDPRDADGRVISGPEYLSILDGKTGQTIERIDWPERQPFLDRFPDRPLVGYNYASRNQLAIAYLDGVHPHLIVLRGTYNLMVARAYRYEGERLREVWRWDNNGLGREFQGQGAHTTRCADIDGDGKDEVVLGSIALDDDGKPLWTTGLGHPDHVYIGDIDPERDGLEIYFGLETRQKERNGMCLADAKTGRILWGHEGPTRHVHGQGLCADLDARFPGSECYSADSDEQKKFAYARLRTARGEVISDEDLGGFAPHSVYWDADLQREILSRGTLWNYGGEEIPPRHGGNIVAIADVIGDWREEIITSVPGGLRIYVSTIPAADRRVTLMRDPIYRGDVTHNAMGYFQVPMLSVDLESAKGKE